MKPITKSLLELKGETIKNLNAVKEISWSDRVEQTIERLRYRLAELNNLLSAASAWEDSPPRDVQEVKEYREMLNELLPRIEGLKKDRMSAGKHNQFIK